jgi:hypothetical protein
VSCINNTFTIVNERCLFPIKFPDYHDEILCDVISMDVEHVILSRSLIYDIIISDRSNSCSFIFKGR